MIASASRLTSSRKSALVAFCLADFDRQVLRRGVIRNRFDELERQEVEFRQDRTDRFRGGLAERVVDVHEHRGARHGAGGAEQVADQREPVAGEIDRGGEVAEHELVALLGDLRGGGDIDHERHAALFRHLRDRRGRARIERADQHVGAFLDQALRTCACRVDVGFGIGVHQLDVDAEHRLQHAGCEIRPFLAGLADEPLHARARQQHADFQPRCLRAYVRGSDRRCGRAGKREVETPAIDCGGHAGLLVMGLRRCKAPQDNVVAIEAPFRGFRTSPFRAMTARARSAP